MTVPHYGKREAGGLTASSPGDTIHFNFGSYNDSGDSEGVLGSLAVTDIEIFKNGIATARATDSGISLISDTGQMGDRVGLNRFSVQLFNTADDTGHYDAGSWYQVAVDAVTIDGKTVRAWVGSFEIGRQRTDLRAINGDTGASIHLSQVYANGFTDTGLYSHITNQKTELDTGLRDTLADYDTGMRALLALRDTGAIATAVWAGDTGLRDHITNVDTGLTQRLDLIRFDVDTGLRDQLADYDTGLRGILVTTGVNVGLIRADTGAADRLLKFAGSQLKVDGTLDTGSGQTTNTLNVTATASTDTGAVNNAVWNGVRSDHVTDGTFGIAFDDIDTGIRTAISQVSATVDTGVVNQAVWQGNATRVLTANTNLAGVAVNVTQLVGDTGAGIHLRQLVADGFTDTGLYSHITNQKAELDTGLRDTLADYDTGIRALLALRDTGAIATAVWAGDTGLRDNLTNVDTGLTARLNTLLAGVNVTQVFGDTGTAAHLSQVYANGFTDTGLYARLDKLAEDTGGVSVNAIFGDTGAAQRLMTAFVGGFTDTGLNDRLARILADTDTGLRNRLVGVLNVDTYAEPTGVPPATDTLVGKIGRLHEALRNRVDVTATKKTFYDDAGAALWEKDLSDDGTTYSESEGNAI